jgi:hypothetical protein
VARATGAHIVGYKRYRSTADLAFPFGCRYFSVDFLAFEAFRDGVPDTTTNQKFGKKPEMDRRHAA